MGGNGNLAAFSRTSGRSDCGMNPTACVVIYTGPTPTTTSLAAWETYCKTTYGAT